MNAKLWYNFLALVCFGLTAGQCSAQGTTSPAVTLDLHQVSYRDFLQALEKQTNFRFFYDTAEFDTTKIDVNVQAQPLFSVLNNVFSGTGMSYSADRYHHIFIAKGDAIITGLPQGFFDKADSGSLAVGDTVRDYLEEVGKATVATIENKLYVIGDK